MKAATNLEANLENAVRVQNSEDLKNLDLTKFSSKQIFGYNCEKCGKYYEKKLSRLKYYNFELLCSKCSLKKHRKPLTEEQKKIALEKRKQTNLSKYGVETPFQSKEIQEKIKQTNLERYGVDNPLQAERIQEKIKQTNLERYGADNPRKSKEIQEKIKQTNLEKYGVDNPRKSKEIQAKIKQTNLSKYGVENPLQSEKVKEKIKQTNLSKYGVENSRKSKEIREKIKLTNLKRYGVEHTWQSEEIQEKRKQTNLEKYGVEYYSQSKEAQSKRKQAYRYDGVSFDSKPELAFYVYYKDHGIEVQRNTREFLYEFQGKTHRYFPDFAIGGELIEIKGDQFLNETTNTWQNPFDHSQDEIYEAKHQCALKNNVKILYSKDYQKCIDYALEKYGKGFFENCRTFL